MVDDEAGAEFGLEPGGLGGHDVAGVGDVHELLHGYGVEGEGECHFAGVDAATEFVEAADASYEVDAFVGSEVVDAEYVAENEVA